MTYNDLKAGDMIIGNAGTILFVLAAEKHAVQGCVTITWLLQDKTVVVDNLVDSCLSLSSKYWVHVQGKSDD